LKIAQGHFENILIYIIFINRKNLGNVGKIATGHNCCGLQGDHLAKFHLGKVVTGHPNSTIISNCGYE